MQFKTTITQDDFKAFQKAAAQNSGIESCDKSFFKNMAIWFVIGLVGIILVNLFKLKLIEFNYPTAIITSIAVLVLILFLTKRNINKMQPFPNGAILGDHEFTLTDNEIIDQKGNHKSSSNYDSILNIVESENNLFLFIDKVAAYLINKKNVSSELDMQEIARHIKEKCNKLS